MPIELQNLRRDASLISIRQSELLRGRNTEFVDLTIELDLTWRQLRVTCDALRSQRKSLSKGIRDKLKSNRKDEAQNDIKRSKELAIEVTQVEKQVTVARSLLDQALSNVGNYPVVAMDGNADDELGKVNSRTSITQDQEESKLLQKNITSCQSLTINILTYLKQHEYIAVDVPVPSIVPIVVNSKSKSESKKNDVQKLDGNALLEAYSSVWVPEAALPIRYVHIDHVTNNLELSVLCHPNNSQTSYIQMVNVMTKYIATLLCKSNQMKCKQQYIEPNNLQLPSVCQTLLTCVNIKNNTDITSKKPKNLAECYNNTDYYSRKLEIRCGHGKGHGPSGSVKRYVHFVRCVLSMDALLYCCTDSKASDCICTEKEYKSTVFEPLTLIRTGVQDITEGKNKNINKKENTNKKNVNKNNSKNKKTKINNNNNNNNDDDDNNNQDNGKTQIKTRANKETKRTKKNQEIKNKLWTKEGMQQLFAIFTRKSFLCGVGWVATHEDSVVFARLQYYMQIVARLEVEKLDVLLKKDRRFQLLTKTTALIAAMNSLNSLKIKLMQSKQNGCTILESDLAIACKLACQCGIKHILTDEAGWFIGQRSFWRWYRCLNVMNAKERNGWLPTMQHLKSGRVSLLFDL